MVPSQNPSSFLISSLPHLLLLLLKKKRNREEIEYKERERERVESVNLNWVPCERGVEIIRAASCVMMWGHDVGCRIIMTHDTGSIVHLGFTFWLHNTFSIFFFSPRTCGCVTCSLFSWFFFLRSLS